MNITGTHFQYYFVCHRKLWLFANGIHMEHTSELVYEGRLIQETAYPRRSAKYQEIEMDGIKIDYFDPRNKIIHEIKKSDKMEEAHEWQLKYYIHVLNNNGIEGVQGILEYPTMRKKKEVFLSTMDKEHIKDLKFEIYDIIHHRKCPEIIRIAACKNCSYHDFCWVGE